MNPDHPQLRKLSSPFAIFATLMLVIFVTETLVMFLLQQLFPSGPAALKTLADPLLLTLFGAPLAWWLIARPLRKAARNEVARTDAVLRSMVDAAIQVDDQGLVESMNPAAERMFGYAPQELAGKPLWLIVSGLRVDKEEKSLPLEPDREEETFGRRKDGTWFAVEVSVSRLACDERPTSLVLVHDIASRKEAAALLQEQREFFENLVQNSAVPTFVLGADHRVLIWNRACEEMTGMPAYEMLGLKEPWRAFYSSERPVLADLVITGSHEEGNERYLSFDRSSFIPEGLQAEGWYRTPNGAERYLLFNAAPIRNAKGDLLAVIETFEDLTERKRYEVQLEYQANHDALTDLPNRNLLNDRIRQALLVARRTGQEVGLFVLDLDNFKQINDTLGHDGGDLLLKKVARRLSECVRSGDTVARHGADEFVVIVADGSVTHNAPVIAGKLLDAVAQPIRINDNEIIITGSIGISVSPKDGNDVETLVKNAEVAMFRAKEHGSNTYSFYTGEMNAKSLARMTVENHLRRALERGELSVHYQPKVSILSGRITGTEALLRWHNPELGDVYPDTFIPLAEETGMIVSIGEWALRTACEQNKKWQDAGLPPLSVAVNLSPRQFRQQDIAATIQKALADSGLEPRYLELEITESMVFRDVERVKGVLDELKRLGTSLSMDDFGTGYSSLSCLKRFPFDKLKIDKAFIRDLTSEPHNAAIAKAVIAMAHTLQMKVIAEGVETEGQLNFLRRHDCDEIQGFLFSKPVPAPELELLLREGRSLPAPPPTAPAPPGNSWRNEEIKEKMAGGIRF